MNDTGSSFNQVKQSVSLETGKYLTFTLAEEEYGIEVLKVKEINGIMPITSVPRTPNFGTRLRHDYIRGMAKRDGGVKILLNIDKVLSADEIMAMEKTV
ncbi:MAG: chemotaxis protein CheW [Desulfotignum sp.]|nr:chemotaxis protein CheW [Desulfotignum sp.]MCF8138401.1 chemotaxis protein CheW [Desulfotignum sp.]